MFLRGGVWPTLSSPISATDKVKNEHHEGDDEQNVDEAPGDLESDSAAPQEQEKNGNNKQHASESRLARVPVVWFV